MALVVPDNFRTDINGRVLWRGASYSEWREAGRVRHEGNGRYWEGTCDCGNVFRTRLRREAVASVAWCEHERRGA